MGCAWSGSGAVWFGLVDNFDEALRDRVSSSQVAGSRSAGSDPDGSIRADLDELWMLGMLDDGMISNRHGARQFELRLDNAGFDVTLDEYPGAHTAYDKVLEVVGYMQSSVDQ